MTKTYYTSDLHFYHKNIVKFTERGKVTTAEDHDAWLKDLWNSQVKEDDFVVHVGDFSFKRGTQAMIELLRSLKGRKVFVLGNHDDEKVMNIAAGVPETQVVQVTNYLRHFLYGQFSQKQKLEIFHYPIGSWRDQAHGSWHLHGHSHGNYADSDKGKILDVGLDSAYKILGEHRFFTEDDIIDHMNAREIYTRDLHRKEEA